MAIQDRKEREKAKRRSDIIRAAEALFFSRGYDSVTMDDIAKKVELNKATIYLYFNNKESLFLAIVQKGMTALNGIMREKRSEELSGPQMIDEFWDKYLDFVNRYPDHFRAFMYFKSQRFGLENMFRMDIQTQPFFSSSLVNVPNGDQIVAILEMHLALFDMLVASVRKGIDEGCYRPDLDPGAAASIILMSIESLASIGPVTKYELDTAQVNLNKYIKDTRTYVLRMLEK